MKLWKEKNYVNENIQNIQMPPNYKIISIDVVSLVTSVQIGIAIKGTKERWANIQPHVNMPWYQFEKGLRICSSNSSVNFQNISYKKNLASPWVPFFLPLELISPRMIWKLNA